jgi:aromatic ring-cleaving dioxygenase
MANVVEYHAHVYFDAATLEKARRICEACRDTFGVVMGRMHEKPVGPHPDWSCQLLVPHEKLADVTRWLMLNRDGLVVLVHPETGNDLKDHTDHAMWMGAVRPLDVSIFKTR